MCLIQFSATTFIAAAIWEYERVRDKTYRIIRSYKQWGIHVCILRFKYRFIKIFLHITLFSEQDGDIQWKIGGKTYQKEKEYLFLYVS